MSILSFIKKTISITIFFVITCNNYINAQEYEYVPFPESDAVWSEIYWKSVFEPYPRWLYNKYAIFNEDTIINGIKYHKLFHTHDTKITRGNSKFIGGIREDSLKRIIANASMFELVPEIEEVILFDFSLNIGDTITQYINDTICTNIRFELVVVDIDTLSINHTKRKVFSFNIPWTHWIEGIGSVQGLVFPSGDLPTNGISNDLVCMHQNDSLLYYYSGSGDIYYDDCIPSFVINGAILLPNPSINVYPNPITDGTAYFENLDFETFELFDFYGKLIKEENIKGVRQFELKTSGFPSGSYFYRLKSKGLLPTQGKLIIE